MAASTTFAGAGTTLSSNYYLRNFYVANRDAHTSSKRKAIRNSELALADGMALRRAVRQLGSMEFSEEKASDIRSSVSAFIATYNHTLSSASASSDRTLNRSMKQMKSMAQEYASDLDKIGITVNDDGTLTRRDALFTTTGIAKFEKLFSSDSDFMQRTAAYARRIERRSEALALTERNQLLSGIATKKNEAPSPAAAVAQFLSTDAAADAYLPAGIGQNINIRL